MRLIFLLLIVFSCTIASTAQSVKVMTYNIRYDNPGDGINSWSNRKDKLAQLISKYNPDIFGVQEALSHQLTDIKNALNDYDFVGVGRDDGKQKGEYSAIFYRKNKFNVINQNTFWLSETPEVAGSKSWDAAITRVATWAKFHDKSLKKDFIFINTHFDHIGQEARKNSAKLLKQKALLLKEKLPLIITGDFNCTRDEDPYKVMMDPSLLKLIDPAPKNPEGTFCNFGVNTMTCKPIDYIFYTSEWTSDHYTVIHDNDGKNYPSDHLPVMVELFLSKK
jgi:endonuclease/exonuclease/phosphatase family metal-dependent hydrolase